RVMLKMLQQQRAKQVEDINKRAVEFYRNRLQTEPRAELLYHMLQLGASDAEIDQYWQPSLRDALERASPELPPEGQVYVAIKTGTDVDPKLRAQASLYSWERFTAQKARELIRYGD